MAETIEVNGETVRVTEMDDGYEAKAVHDEPMVVVESAGGSYGFKIPLSEADQFELTYQDSGELDIAVWNTDVDESDMNSSGAGSRQTHGNFDGHAAVSSIRIEAPF